MTIKLILLKSGEDIISDVSEMAMGDEESPYVVGYRLNKPCIVKIFKSNSDNNTVSLNDSNGKEKPKINVSLYPWMPLSSEEVIPIPTDWVVTMVEPVQSLKEMYIEDVVNYGTKANQDTGTSKQSDSNQSD